MKNILNSDKIIFLDGAMGTMLQSGLLPLGELPEMLVFTNPDAIANIHKKYLEAGADIIYANTFGVNKFKLDNAEAVIEAAIRLAVETAKPYGAAVALDIGSLGKLFFSFDELYEAFVPLVKAGERAGADLVVFETMSDLTEMRAAVLATKEHTKLPILATMTFEANGRSFTGVSAAAFARTITALGADAIGLNCSLGPADVLPIVRQLRTNTTLPLAVKPNAGLPDSNGAYTITAEVFANFFEAIIAEGVQIIGGCCGTTPAYISALKARYKDTIPTPISPIDEYIICSATRTQSIDKGLIVVGERLNPTGKKQLSQAIVAGDIDYLMMLAKDQEDDGAKLLDINVGVAGVDEATTMKSVVEGVQTITALPLVIDSSNPAAIEAGLRAFNGIGIINSVNGKTQTIKQILPIAKKYGAFVIGLCLDEDGIPTTAAKRVEIAEKIMNAAIEYGIPPQKLIIDCLVLTASAQQAQATETLNAVQIVRENLGLLTLLGVSNISFGLPDRGLINTTFLTMAAQAGLNLAIINPAAPEVKRTVAAIRVLTGDDNESTDYIKLLGGSQSFDGGGDLLKEAVVKGLTAQAGELTAVKLSINTPDDIIQNSLIPALDIVGAKFEKGEFFLPQLISSANAAEAAFGVIREFYKNSGTKQKGKGTILICTVKGDIHDIGKNIVKTLLENYGFDVFDLGKDVSKERILAAVIETGAGLVGLSALMTTTVTSMEDTIKHLKVHAPNVKIMVGGAVLTEEIAAKIGADFYAADAKQGVDIANKIFGSRYDS